jgi:hypothetical protein
LTTLPLTSNFLAVGDFDGTAATPDTILVLSTTANRSIGICRHVVPNITGPCIVACDVTTCP